MSAELIIGIVLCLLLLLITIGVPIGLSLALAGAIGIAAVDSFGTATSVLGRSTFASASSYSLIVLPMFVLLGAFARFAKIPEAVFDVAERRLRRVPGGLAFSTVVANSAFGVVSGSSVAAVATVGPMAIPSMLRHGYRKEVAGASVAAAGTLGIIIPPSIMLVMFALVAGESVGAMLLAAIIPAILTAIGYAGICVGMGLTKRVFRRDWNPAIDGASAQRGENETGRFGGVIAMAKVSVIFAIVLLGIYFGLYTVTESAAIAAFAAGLILFLTANRASGSLRRSLRDSFSETVSSTSMLFLILVGGAVFSFFLVITGVPARLAAWAADLAIPPVGVIAVVIVLLLILGMFLDGMSVMLIVTPLLHPVVTELGFSGLWFGVLFIKTVEIGLLTPPVGINAFVVAGSVKQVTAEQVFRGALPFIASDLLVVLALILFPSLATWLPSLMTQ